MVRALGLKQQLKECDGQMRNLKAGMELLMKQREKGGVDSSNPYFFALPGTPKSGLNPWKALGDFVKSGDLEMPELVTSTKLRKYLGNISHCFPHMTIFFILSIM